MSQTCPTVMIKSDHPDHISCGGYIVINESDFDPKVHVRHVPLAPLGELPPPPVVIESKPPADPLAKLPTDWKESLKDKKLIAIAGAVSGRTPDNREQAVQIIDQELAARAAAAAVT
jgi:hypothetical protein